MAVMSLMVPRWRLERRFWDILVLCVILGEDVTCQLSAFSIANGEMLSARIPQIVKNYREKSCEGLALLFFILSLTGNLTYGVGILCHSLEKEYLITNLPWLIGSLGTMVEDGIIFLQFRIYSSSASAVE
jgi:uncharacterized protein with PQ loop repeat